MPLARDNHTTLCSPCSRREVQVLGAPVQHDEFWECRALREALESRHFGQLLYAYRHEHRPVLTQAKVGHWLGLTQGQVSRLERSTQPTNDLDKLDQWARALHIPERSLWFRLSRKPNLTYPGSRVAYSLDYESNVGGDVQRRKLLQHVRQLLEAVAVSAAFAGGSAFEWFGALPAPSSGTRAVGMTDVQMIREMTQVFRQLDNRFGGGHARSALTSYLAYDVAPLLRESRYRDEVGPDLAAAVAELNQLAGWMAYDVGDADSGRRHLRQAMRLSLATRNDALAGEMLAGMSHQAAFLRFPSLALDLARASKDKAKQAGIPALVSESTVMEAHALALANDVRGCLAALRESERAFDTAEKRERPEWLAYFDGAYLAAKFGHCVRDLERPVEAERFARRSLEMIEGYDRGRLFNLVLLASTLADQRKVEEACENGLAAVHIARNVQSVRAGAYLADLSRRLDPFKTQSAVQTLDAQIQLVCVPNQ